MERLRAKLNLFRIVLGLLAALSASIPEIRAPLLGSPAEAILTDAQSEPKPAHWASSILRTIEESEDNLDDAPADGARRVSGNRDSLPLPQARQEPDKASVLHASHYPTGPPARLT